MNFAAMLEQTTPPQWSGKSRRHVLLDRDVPPPKQKTPKPREAKPKLPRMTMAERAHMNMVLMFNLGRALGSN